MQAADAKGRRIADVSNGLRPTQHLKQHTRPSEGGHGTLQYHSPRTRASLQSYLS